jgi:pimeloyl-ACP methyl ester carboxylesterase
MKNQKIGFLVAFVFICGGLSSCFRPFMNEKKIQRKITHPIYKPVLKQYECLGRQISYVEIGNPTAPMVVFIHGAPGNLKAFLSFLKDSTLLEKARLIAVDRPGYGGSGFGKTEISVEKQAAMILPILQSNQNEQLPILVGHSYGGTLAVRLAMDYPDKVGSLILAGPAVDPENEKKFWVNKPADWKAIRWMLPKAIRVSNDEKLSHVEELQKMKPFWEKVTAPTTIIHGENDGIVPFANGLFAQKMLVNAKVDTIFRKKMGHISLIWKKDIIKPVVLKYLGYIQAD